ncbi:MAG TPA: AmmeMemoRadiSam system radical SAM enzyme [Verrucomicrobiota bacterium]|nr:AmmeMemoRadiSam system radical SAM enzyme [Verrucomicrobiota bacterium]HNU52775.1 AmmeMemoRadiSam system radical SAM enzyme [Verrucomicrobiota bacterium]
MTRVPQPGSTTRPIPRRQALLWGADATLALFAADSWFPWLARWRQRAASADIFPGDAPDDALWALWQQRGWAREALHYLKLGPNVQCKLCPNNCLLKPGDRSHCRNRINRNGTLYTLAYGNPCTFHVDPIEKKPLFHYLPGSRSFSVATAGCVFRCLNCQNWEISQRKPEETKDPRGPEFRLRPPLPASLTRAQLQSLSLFPEDLAAVAEALACATVSYTYSEPTAFYEYTLESCRQVRARGLRNVLVTCGSIEERPLRELAPFVDAAHVDLKGFDEGIYQKLNSGRLEPVLRTLRVLRELGVWIEVIHLVVPTYTDAPDVFRRLAAWVAAHLGPDCPLHVSRFQPQHKLTHLPPTPLDTLLRARELARGEGLHHVYIGNVRGLPDAETTFCPKCHAALIERDVFAITRNRLRTGACPDCGTRIAGVWSPPPARG